MKIEKSTGNALALSELVQRDNAETGELRAPNPCQSSRVG